MTTHRPIRLAIMLGAGALLAGAVTLPAPDLAVAQESRSAESAEVTVVVTLRGPSALAAARTRTASAVARDRVAQLRTQHTSVLDAARESGLTVDKRADYVSVVNGMAVTVPADQVDALRALPGVAGVHADEEYHATLADAVPHVHAPDVWSRLDDRGRPVKGTGETVAILDTGIDYTHPDLGGCFGRGCRVVGGHDFVNGDDDPMDDNFHGTHVAGIIGASGSAADSATGVAPDVRLLAYKVLDQNGGGTLADILAGLDAATDPFNLQHPGVVNMSLGNDVGDGTDLLSQAVQTATEAGFVVVVAAGNTGPDVESMGAPAAAPGALTVGASTTGVVTPRARIVAPEAYDPKASRLEFSANPAAGTTELDVVDVGPGTPTDYDGLDVTGKAVVVDSGDSPYSWFQSGIAAEQHGATAALIVEADPDEPSQTALAGPREPDAWPTGLLTSGDDGRLDSLVAMRISQASATDLRGFLARGSTRLALDAVDATDTIPAFSSRGPSGLLGGKPDLVAPGVEIRSTVPLDTFGTPYGRVSGTSMAAPMVSGAAALLAQLHPRWTSDRIAAALTASARRLPGRGPLAQGAGLLDVAAAADTVVTATPRVASLGLADMSGQTVGESTTIRLTNDAMSVRSFRLDVRESTGRQADVTVSPRTVRLAGGERRAVTVTAVLPTPAKDLDVSGWISANVDGAGRADLTIPYSLSVRPFDLFATPDPAVDGSTVYLRAPAQLAEAPTLSITGPGKFRRTVTARLDHGYWWRARVPPVRRASTPHGLPERSARRTAARPSRGPRPFRYAGPAPARRDGGRSVRTARAARSRFRPRAATTCWSRRSERPRCSTARTAVRPGGSAATCRWPAEAGSAPNRCWWPTRRRAGATTSASTPARSTRRTPACCS